MTADKALLSEGECDLIWHTAIRSDLDDVARRAALESIIEALIFRRLAKPKHEARKPHPATMAGR